MRWLDSTTKSVDMNLSKHREIVKDRGAWSAAVHGGHRVGRDLVTERFNLTTRWCYCFKNTETKASSLNRHTTSSEKLEKQRCDVVTENHDSLRISSKTYTDGHNWLRNTETVTWRKL